MISAKGCDSGTNYLRWPRCHCTMAQVHFFFFFLQTMNLLQGLFFGAWELTLVYGQWRKHHLFVQSPKPLVRTLVTDWQTDRQTNRVHALKTLTSLMVAKLKFLGFYGTLSFTIDFLTTSRWIPVSSIAKPCFRTIERDGPTGNASDIPTGHRSFPRQFSVAFLSNAVYFGRQSAPNFQGLSRRRIRSSETWVPIYQTTRYHTSDERKSLKINQDLNYNSVYDNSGLFVMGDQKVSVHLMITVQRTSAQRFFDHPVYDIVLNSK